MKIKFIVEKTKNGYSAYSEEYPIFTTGKTLSELKIQALEAVRLYFNDNKPYNIQFEQK